MISGKEVTIYDIAQKLNISSATVSRALKDDPVVSKRTKQKIAARAEEMGYRINYFASNLRKQHTNTIGVIIPRINSNFMSNVVSGIEHVASEAGYNLIISQSGESLKKEIANANTMFKSRVDGLLVSLSYETEDIKHFEIFFKKNIPLIFYDRGAEHIGCTNVVIDNRRKAFEATSHLINQGCRRIIHITTKTKRSVYLDRLQGYKEALSENNIEFRQDYIIFNDLSQAAGTAAADVIQKIDPMPDAVFVSNDTCAVGCIIALKAKGIRIPGDICFVGFNNDPVSTIVEPNLTTVNYPGYEIGEVAARNLIDHLTGKSNLLSTDTILLRSDLIIRASSLKNPGAVS